MLSIVRSAIIHTINRIDFRYKSKRIMCLRISWSWASIGVFFLFSLKQLRSLLNYQHLCCFSWQNGESDFCKCQFTPTKSIRNAYSNYLFFCCHHFKVINLIVIALGNFRNLCYARIGFCHARWVKRSQQVYLFFAHFSYNGIKTNQLWHNTYKSASSHFIWRKIELEYNSWFLETFGLISKRIEAMSKLSYTPAHI